MKRFLIAALLLLILANALAEPANSSAYTLEEKPLARDGQKLYGKLYLPEDAAPPLPLVILSHGLGSNHTIMEPYAEYFAENGIAAYVFDYIGGSEVSLSDGTMTDMSILTEAEDLGVILDHFLTDERFERDSVFLFGGSQGGFVSAYVAGKRPGDVAGLVLLYPAFNLQDICRKMVEEGGVPDSAWIGEHTVGSIYFKDMLTFDIYEVMKQYTGPALLFHGTADAYVPVEYSRKATDSLPNSALVIVEGANHGFKGADFERVADQSTQFVEAILEEASSMDNAA